MSSKALSSLVLPLGLCLRQCLSLPSVVCHRPVFKQLEEAVAGKDEADITDAISAAKAISFEHALVKDGQDFLDKKKKERDDAAAAKAAAEAAANAASAEEAAAIKKAAEEKAAALAAEQAMGAQQKLDNAKKGIEDANAMPDDDLTAKRKALNAAVLKAEEVEFDDPMVSAAKELAEALNKKISAKRKLESAKEDQDVETLTAAVAACKEAGLEAEATEGEGEIAKIEAAVEFDKAIDSGDQAKMDAAYEVAVAAGLKVDKPVKGKKVRRMTDAQKKSKSGQKDLLDDIEVRAPRARPRARPPSRPVCCCAPTLPAFESRAVLPFLVPCLPALADSPPPRPCHVMSCHVMLLQAMPYGARLAEMEKVFVLEKVSSKALSSLVLPLGFCLRQCLSLPSACQVPRAALPRGRRAARVHQGAAQEGE
eukprot:SAG22_NODE_272_length_13192_cov_311.812495_2_plen_425_part_00